MWLGLIFLCFRQERKIATFVYMLQYLFRNENIKKLLDEFVLRSENTF